MSFHPSTFEYLKPTDDQIERMKVVREAAAEYAMILDRVLPDGSDKTYILRAHRSNAMWGQRGDHASVGWDPTDMKALTPEEEVRMQVWWAKRRTQPMRWTTAQGHMGTDRRR